MKTTAKRLRGPVLSVPLLGLLLAACGDPPQPVEESTSPMSARGGTATGTLPPGHPPTQPRAADARSQDARFEGVVRLRGALAERESGFVFVSVMPEGSRMPIYSRKYSLDEPAVGAAEDGERVLRFELDRRYALSTIPPGQLELNVRFDPDGIVDSKEPEVLDAAVPIEPNRTDVEVVLDPGRKR
jgi:hypothetical protein